MKHIISPRRQPRFIIYCPKCTCRFIYEESDLNEHDIVTCPICNERLYHSTTHVMS